ncbi:hypothetical protein GCM10028856_13960 [Halopiger thermotolerans]
MDLAMIKDILHQTHDRRVILCDLFVELSYHLEFIKGAFDDHT